MNLRKEDKSSAPKVSFIRRFHCTIHYEGASSIVCVYVPSDHNNTDEIDFLVEILCTCGYEERLTTIREGLGMPICATVFRG